MCVCFQILSYKYIEETGTQASSTIFIVSTYFHNQFAIPSFCFSILGYVYCSLDTLLYRQNEEEMKVAIDVPLHHPLL